MFATVLDHQQLTRTKVAYVAHRLDLTQPLSLLHSPGRAPRSGELILATVAEIGQFDFIDLASGRKARLFPGDDVIVAYGARYAPDFFEANMPADLGPCDLAATGGLAARVVSSHRTMGTPTRLVPRGYLGDEHGRPITVADLQLPEPPPAARQPLTVLVVGTAMNSGKTTALASLIRGLTTAGYEVGAAKVTGTAAPGDPNLFRDAGAVRTVDFTDAGYPSTYQIPVDELVRSMLRLHGHLAATGATAIVLELSDGIFQRETAALLERPELLDVVDGVMFTAGDAAGAAHGVGLLRAAGLPAIAVSGLLTSAPLAIAEAMRVLDVPVLRTDELTDADVARELVAAMERTGARRLAEVRDTVLSPAEELLAAAS